MSKYFVVFFALFALLALVACQGSASQPMTAEEVLNALAQANLPIGDTITFTAETDPNDLLGRPGQYISKVNFRDTRLSVEDDESVSTQDGGSIEVFADAQAAEARAQYIHALGQGVSVLAEYDFVEGYVLLRLSRRITPAQAQEYADALAALFN